MWGYFQNAKMIGTNGQVHPCKRNMNIKRILHQYHFWLSILNKYILIYLHKNHTHSERGHSIFMYKMSQLATLKRQHFVVKNELIVGEIEGEGVQCTFWQQLVLWCFTRLARNWITILCANDAVYAKLHVNELMLCTYRITLYICHALCNCHFKHMTKSNIFLSELANISG